MKIYIALVLSTLIYQGATAKDYVFKKGEYAQSERLNIPFNCAVAKGTRLKTITTIASQLIEIDSVNSLTWVSTDSSNSDKYMFKNSALRKDLMAEKYKEHIGEEQSGEIILVGAYIDPQRSKVFCVEGVITR